jgi:hypothetical protein
VYTITQQGCLTALLGKQELTSNVEAIAFQISSKEPKSLFNFMTDNCLAVCAAAERSNAEVIGKRLCGGSLLLNLAYTDGDKKVKPCRVYGKDGSSSEPAFGRRVLFISGNGGGCEFISDALSGQFSLIVSKTK